MLNSEREVGQQVSEELSIFNVSRVSPVHQIGHTQYVVLLQYFELQPLYWLLVVALLASQLVPAADQLEPAEYSLVAPGRPVEQKVLITCKTRAHAQLYTLLPQA